MRAEYRRLPARLYALAEDRKGAFGILGAERTGNAGQSVGRGDLAAPGYRQMERSSLASAGVQAVHFLLDTLYASGDNLLALGKPDRALEVADMALEFIPLVGGKEASISFQVRERGDLWGLKARAHTALGQQEEALGTE